ncbi:LANO_0D04280g1_1 [Lachancea nothofagi CBS 11611]|uniref:LANO_0D04280g1_1 n=1 Tax=Lachancea nothofagi CBS 11611 TaxID=1266666 RepID=A0A1G4JG84_9SACH|nr:LANO_0D04280g1_1 [Lachancea nothofagi CBS 11611]
MIEKQVVVIGAGISGLKTASELYAKGCKSCVVLEARDRIGGRLYTAPGYNNNKYDLGASWHHDTLVNGLFLEEVGLPKEERAAFVFDDDAMIVFDKERGRVDQDPEMALEVLMEELLKFNQLQYFEDLDVKDVNYFETIVKYLYERRDLLTDEQIQYLPQVARFMESWHGIDWKTQSSKCLEIAHQGRNAFVLNYDTIVKRVGSAIPQEWIKMETEVSEIDSEGKKVVVTTKTGEKYACDYVVVTIPQSILAHSLKPEPRKGRIEFNPPLASGIQDAFKKTHYGSLGKVVFEFKDCCWSRKRSRVLSLGSSTPDITAKVRDADDLASLVEKLNLDTQYNFKNGESWDFPLFFVNLAKHTDIPSLILLMADPLTAYIESLPDKEKLYEYFEPILTKVLQALDCTEPIVKDFDDKSTSDGISSPVLKNIMTTKWTLDEYALGAYSACEPGDDPMDLILSLTNNQTSKIRFAGEHTIMDGAGCVYGAWGSGKREAAFIADKLGNFGSHSKTL